MKNNKVLIIGYYGMGNAGAEVRLHVLVDDIRKANPEADITIATFKYSAITRIKDVHYLFLNNAITAVIETLLQLPKFDYVICGEGIPFVDFCGTGFLDYFLPVLDLAKKIGKKTCCYAFDIDHLTKIHKHWAMRILKKTDLLLVRTKKSKEYFKENNIDVKLGTDCSFLFNTPKLQGNKKKIGFCFKDFYCYPIKCRPFGSKENTYHYPLFYTYAKHGKNKYKQFVQEMSDLIDILLMEDKKLEIQFIVLEHHMDYKITKDIYDNVKNNKRIEIVSKKTHTLRYMKSLFSNLECLIAARYHAILLSLEYKIPTLVLSTDERFDYFVEELGLKRFLINVYEEDIKIAGIMKFIKKAWVAKPIFSEKITRQYPSLVKKAENNYKFLIPFFKK